MIKNFSSPKIKIWFEPMFFSEFFCGFERCGSLRLPSINSGQVAQYRPPPFRIFAGGIFRKNAFGLIQEYCTTSEKVKEFWFSLPSLAPHFFFFFFGGKKHTIFFFFGGRKFFFFYIKKNKKILFLKL